MSVPRHHYTIRLSCHTCPLTAAPLAARSSRVATKRASHQHDEAPSSNRSVEVVIEIPKWSFIKRGSSGQVDFVAPFPCPFNYGSVPEYVGLDGDLLDALVLGPRLPRGVRVMVEAHAAVGMSERGMYDDKIVTSQASLGRSQARRVLWFFHFYAFCKGSLNILRGYRGFARCEGWGSVDDAIARATPRDDTWTGPRVPF